MVVVVVVVVVVNSSVYRAVTTTLCQSWTLCCRCLNSSSTLLVYIHHHCHHHHRRHHWLGTSCGMWNSWYSTYMLCSCLRRPYNWPAVSCNLVTCSRLPLSETVRTTLIVPVLILLLLVVGLFLTCMQ